MDQDEAPRDGLRDVCLLAGFPESVAGATVNRLCGSGLEAVSQAARSVMLGEADVYIGGGVESMSRAPYVLPKPAHAFPTGHTTMYDTTLDWRMVNPRVEELGHTDSLGATTENLAEERYGVTPEEQRPEGLAGEYDISRERQDRFALRSHEKAVAAQDGMRFRDEIAPVTVKGRKGEHRLRRSATGSPRCASASARASRWSSKRPAEPRREGLPSPTPPRGERSLFPEDGVPLRQGNRPDVLQYLRPLPLFAGAQVIGLLPSGVGPDYPKVPARRSNSSSRPGRTLREATAVAGGSSGEAGAPG